jgi:hypothetical protein
MFATWKYDAKDNDVLSSAQTLSFDPITAKTTGTKACSLCRAKKLKCDGDRSGCQRCKTQGQECTYIDTIRHQRKSNTPRNLEHTETRKSVSSTASLTSSSFPNAQHQQEQEQQQQQQQEQQQQQQQEHDDLSWLMAQPPNMRVFTELELLDDGTLQHAPLTLIGDVGATADPSDIFVDLSSSMLNNSSSLHPSLLPQTSPLDVVDGEAETECKSHESSSAPCQCLYRVVMVMDKLGMQDDLQDDCAMEKSVNNLLILHKEALSSITSMLGCAACTRRVENMLVLVMLMDKLARLCHRIVHITGDSTRPTPAVNLGDYKVDSAEEYAALVGSLLGVQLRRLQTLAQSLHHVSLRFHSETLEHRLTVCSGFVTRSLDALRNLCR